MEYSLISVNKRLDSSSLFNLLFCDIIVLLPLIIKKRNMIKYTFKLVFALSLLLFLYSCYTLVWDREKIEAYEKIEGSLSALAAPALEEKKDRVEELLIEPGKTFGQLMDEAEIGYSIQTEIYNASRELYDLVKIRSGRTLNLIFDKDTNNLKELVYQIDTEEKLHVRKVKIEKEELVSASSSLETQEVIDEHEWQASIEEINYEIRIKTSSGVVESSMYQAALDHNIDERAIIELANAFQWTIDFAMDPRKGDTFKFVYEERYLDGEYVMPGEILAGQYVNDGTKYELYYFEENENNVGFFDENGNSVQKMFLKAPVEFRYISSGYTTGNRVVMEIGLSGPHRAIDYAAPIGTPIRAVGDGTITFAGWSSAGYGYLTSIRHNGTYSTNYAHQSKIAVRVGQKVKQGEVIGYVGSTGYSTGPHLHYEMVKNGTKINPQLEVLPPGKAIAEDNKERFFEEKNEFVEMMDSLK